MNKKALGPVIAISLLVIVSVVAVIGFQSWYQSYSSKTFTDVETKDKSQGITIESISDNYLYVKNSNSNNETINSIKVGGVDCNLNQELVPGVTSIDIGSCFSNSNSNGEQDIVLVTNNKIIEKKLFLKDLDYTTCVDITNGIVGLWNFDNNVSDLSSNSNDGLLYGDTKLLMNFDDGTATDLTDYSNDGTITGANCAVAGINGQGCSFDGINDYINIVDSSSLKSTDYLSVNFWVKPTSGPSVEKSMISKFGPNSNGWQTYINEGSGSIFFYIKNTLGSAWSNNWIWMVSSLNLDEWNHVYISVDYSEGIGKMYINGALRKINSTPNGVTSPTSNTQPLRIGGLPTNYFNGLIDEVAIYSEALSDSEVANLYNSQKAKFIEYKDSNLGTALEFDGVDDYVSLGDLELSRTTPVSYGTWVNIDGYKNWIILNSGNSSNSNRVINLGNSGLNGDFICGRSNHWTFAGYNISLNKWTHIFCVDNFDIMKIYVNGVLVKEDDYDESSILPGVSSDKSYIGTFIGGSDWYFNGSLNEVVIYNRTLSSQEVLEIYQAGLAKKPICNP